MRNNMSSIEDKCEWYLKGKQAMNLLEELQVLGVDIQDALKRFVNNAALYEKMLKKFPAAANDLPVESNFASGNLDIALANAHTLKGMTGNLSLTPLYNAYTDIVAFLRANNPEEARQLLTDIIPVQEKIIACIEKYI